MGCRSFDFHVEDYLSSLAELQLEELELWEENAKHFMSLRINANPTFTSKMCPPLQFCSITPTSPIIITFATFITAKDLVSFLMGGRNISIVSHKQLAHSLCLILSSGMKETLFQVKEQAMGLKLLLCPTVYIYIIMNMKLWKLEFEWWMLKYSTLIWCVFH